MSSDVTEIFFDRFSLCSVSERFDFFKALFLYLRDLFKSSLGLLILDSPSTLR